MEYEYCEGALRRAPEHRCCRCGNLAENIWDSGDGRWYCDDCAEEAADERWEELGRTEKLDEAGFV